MQALALLRRLSDAGFSVQLRDGQAVVRGGAAGIPEPLLAELRLRRAEVIEILRRAEAGQQPLLDAPESDAQFLSPGQRRLWFLNQLHPGEPSYNVPLAFRVLGRFAWLPFEQAFSEVVRRHQVLRTSYPSDRGEPAVRVVPAAGFTASQVDLTGLDADEREPTANAVLDALTSHAFDLARGPVVMLTHVRLDDECSIVALVVHHIAFDGWSLGVLARELEQHFERCSGGAPTNLPELRSQYAELQSASSKSELDRRSTHADYWRMKLRDLPMLAWPAQGWSARAAHVEKTLPRGDYQRLRAFVRAESTTLFTVVLSVLGVLVRARSGETDFGVGTDLAGRSAQWCEDVIGFFANQVVLRVDVGGAPPFRELIERAGSVVREVLAHGDMPYDAVVGAVGRPSHGSTALFRIKLVLQPEDAVPVFPGLRLEPIALYVPSAKFDLLVNVFERADGLALSLDYRLGTLGAVEASRWLDDFVTLLHAVLERPTVRVDQLVALLASVDVQRARSDREEVRRIRHEQSAARRAPREQQT